MTKSPETKLGLYLRQLRVADGLTQQEVADNLGVKRQVISLWEAGARRPKIKRLKRIAENYTSADYSLLLNLYNAPQNTVKVEDMTTQKPLESILNIRLKLLDAYCSLVRHAYIQQSDASIRQSIIKKLENIVTEYAHNLSLY